MYKSNREYKSYYEITRFSFRIDMFYSIIFLTMCSCSQIAHSNDIYTDEAYPKVSEDATQLILLRSNLERTHFFIDNQEMGIGKKLIVKVNNHGHTIKAEPDNCEKSYEEFVQPPYNADSPISFTFLVDECVPPPPVVATNEPGGMSGFTFNGGNVNINTGSNTGTQSNTSGNSQAERILNASSSKKKSQEKPKKSSVTNKNSSSPLDEINNFVEKVCPPPPNDGGSVNQEYSGTAKAGLSGLIKNMADLGFEGAIKYQSSDHQGVLQQDLASVINKNSDCRHDVSMLLINKLIK